MLYKFNKIQKKLIKGRKKSNAGRSTNGRICVRFKGGCNKRKYREVDFTFKTIFPISQILSVEYDPNRSGFISLIKNLITNKNSYILTPNNIHKGHLILSFKQKSFAKSKNFNKSTEVLLINKFAQILKLIYLLNIKSYVFIDKEFSDEKFNLLLYIFVKKKFAGEIPILQNNGNILPLYLINKGNPIFNIEMYPNTKSIFARAAGVFATILFHTQKSTIIYLGAGEYKILNRNCFAAMGRVSNVNKKQKKMRKASDSRWKNKLPHVRGVAMNPVDHPHGGGEGKTSGGRPSVTPWGIPTKGFKTSRKKKLFKSTLINIMNASSQDNHL